MELDLSERWQRHRRVLLPLASLCGALLLFVLAALFVPPPAFPSGVLVTIPVNASSEAIGSQFKQQHLVFSGFLFQLLTRLTREDRTLASGIYVFGHPIGLAQIAWRVSHGERGITAARVTLTEGMTTAGMTRALSADVPGFDAAGFKKLASTSEGYLFPDTYFVYPGTSAQAIYAQLTGRFKERAATLAPQTDAFGKPLRDVVIMASILEREADTPSDMRIVSGILWKRIALGMPLQIDAAFGYAHGSDGYVPTAADLASDSLYNTYLRKGLPPTPIANPGLAALQAAVTPAKTSYLYYLTGTDGKMHYAKTFDEHKANIAKYLK